MIFLVILRWICGYVEFEIRGRFPERLINLAAQNGISLWKVQPKSGVISARARVRDYRKLRYITRKCQAHTRIKRRFGARFLAAKYWHRRGLLIGAALFVAICQILSMFVWVVDINAPDIINEYELREQLAENGVYVGALKSSIQKTETQHIIILENSDISWMSINIMGSVCEVEISPNIQSSDEASEAVATNMKATTDGVITRLEIKNGTAAVVVGQGVTEDMLLVSGVLEYSNGQSVLVQADAKVFARTTHTLQVEIPYDYSKITKTDSEIVKRSVNIMGLSVPLTLCGTPSDTYIKTVHHENVSLFDTMLPIEVETEVFQSYEYISQTLSASQAEETAMEQLEIEKFFTVMSLSEAEILDEQYETEILDDGVVVTLTLTLEENICKSEEIQVKDIT